MTIDYNFVINILEVFTSDNYFSPAQKPALSKCQNTLTMIYINWIKFVGKYVYNCVSSHLEHVFCYVVKHLFDSD